MAGCFPDTRVHQDAGVEADHVPALLDEVPPPKLLDVVAQLDAKRTEVPRVRQAAVDVRTRVHETAALAQRNDLVHGGRSRGFRLFAHSLTAPLHVNRRYLSIPPMSHFALL